MFPWGPNDIGFRVVDWEGSTRLMIFDVEPEEPRREFMNPVVANNLVYWVVALSTG
jgi:hypothetical protein